MTVVLKRSASCTGSLKPSFRGNGVPRCRLVSARLRLRRSYCSEWKVNADMDVTLIIKLAGVGVLVAVAAQILSKSGRDEQAMLVTVAGIVVALMLLVGEIGELFGSVRSIFGF